MFRYFLLTLLLGLALIAYPSSAAARMEPVYETQSNTQDPWAWYRGVPVLAVRAERYGTLIDYYVEYFSEKSEEPLDGTFLRALVIVESGGKAKARNRK